MGAKSMSSAEVSSMAGVLDARVGASRDRNLEGGIPNVWLDAIDVKAREDGRFVLEAMLVANGVNTEGHREALAL